MTRPLRPSEQHRHILDAITWLERLAHDHATVVAHLRDWSGGLSSGGGPQPVNSISDPTGNAALSIDEWGQMRGHIADLVLKVYRAAKDLEHIRRQVAVVTDAEPKPRDRGLAHCANAHGCPDDAWASKAGRCEACYRYKLRTDRDRRKSKDPRVVD